MANVKNEQLFRLIKTLSKGEKRFFKIYATRNGGKENRKFISLFDAVEKQSDYNEDKILKKEPNINPKQLSNLKAHLYFQILKSLKLQNSYHVESIKIIEFIDYATVLYSKCLYKDCIVVLDKAKLLAQKNDSSVLLLEILELEKLVLPKTLTSGNTQRVDILIKSTNKVTESIKNINTFSNLSLKLNSFYTQIGFIRNKKDLDKVTRFFNSSLPKYVEKKLSFQEKLYLYNSYVGFYLFTQNFNKSYEYAKKWVQLFESSPEMKTLKLEMYIKALNSLLVAQNKLYKYHEFIETQKKLSAIKRNKDLVLTENINLNLFKAIYIHEINRHFMLGEFKSGTKIVVALENELNKFVLKLDIHSILLFYYKIACLYIGSGNYKIALKWLSRIYNEKEINIREDIYSFTRILLLVCYSELGNTDLLEFNIRSTYRYFKKKKELGNYQKYILDFIRNLFVSNANQNLKKEYQNLKNKLISLENKKFEKRAFMYFDIISWLESKIESKSVQDIIKEKVKTKLKAHNNS